MTPHFKLGACRKMAIALLVLGLIVLLSPTVMAKGFFVKPLVADVPGAPFMDTDLKNPWGLVSDPFGDFTVADNGTGLITRYDEGGARDPLRVMVPPAPVNTQGTPTGLVRNSTLDFKITSGTTTKPATFIVATEDGTLAGWNKLVNQFNAIQEVDNSPLNAVYKGLTTVHNSTGNYLFATDFHNGMVVIFDANWIQVGSFFDPSFPPTSTPTFAPFGIRTIGNFVYVTYALQNAARHDDVAGVGNGFVDVFDTFGNFLRRFTTGGTLNSPWGLERAPANVNLGIFTTALLVGNFGDGKINAYNINTGAFLGQLRNQAGAVISIQGLWSIEFDRELFDDPELLYFTAGINHEADGLMGRMHYQ